MSDPSGQLPLLIVNPNAGGGKARRVFPDLRPVIERALGPTDVVFTERSAHGIDLARAAAQEGRKLVVAVGGDGTLNEVANGVLTSHFGGGAAPPEATRTAVGFIGQGTGGDFRRTLGLEHRLDRYLEAIASGRTRAIDVGKIRYRDPRGQSAERYFINILSAGMGGLVDRYVADASRLFGPTLAYYGASLRALANIERGRLKARITEDGTIREETIASYMFAICNGRFFGSGMEMGPMAKPDDGRFEVVSIDGDSKAALLTLSRAIYSGAHLQRSTTRHFGCQRIALELQNAADAAATFLLDCDGEPIGGLPIEVEVVPRVLTLRA